MKNNILKLVKWFCGKLTYNDLTSAIVILHEVLSNQRSDIELKPEEKPPHYREFRVDLTRPLTSVPAENKEPSLDWEKLKQELESMGKKVKPVQHRSNSLKLPPNCRCEHCNAPHDYLYLNDGRKGNQIRCKICKKLSPTHRVRKESLAKYWCPHCGYALGKWKVTELHTAYKCPNKKCSFFIENQNNLTKEERQMITEGKSSQFKLHYQYREYQFDPQDIASARPAFETKTDLKTIRKKFHEVCMALTYFINVGLSSRQTRDILRRVHGIKMSHQSVINYANACAALLSDFIDSNLPVPKGTVAGDETYISVENRMQYTWFNIDCETRAICGYNLSGTREPAPCLSLLYNTYNEPKSNKNRTFEYVADGLGSYDNAIVAYNAEAGRNVITRHTVIGLKNLDPESEEYRPFKQVIERFNRTYKFHTRPRAGFKTFEGAVCLTVLFVAFYNFMRPHQALKGKPPIQLECLKGEEFYQKMWAKFLIQVV